MIYDLIICWNDGLKDTFSFTSEEAVINVANAFKKAYGNQVRFYWYKHSLYLILTLDIIS